MSNSNYGFESNVRTVGVIGAGVMGIGLAQTLAQTGHYVILIDISDRILESARDAILQDLRFHKFFKGKIEELDPAEILKKITFSTEIESLRRIDYVFENVPEQWDLKSAIYRTIDEMCDKQIVFAANTSCIPISRIGAITRRAPRVIGTHFMNPVPLKTMVEVIPGNETSAETLAITKALLARMGKEWIVVKDSPGFVTNRVLMLSINEAIFLLHEQVASAEEVDRLFTTCFGHKMGPLATADLIGLDTILLSLEVLCESFDDDKYRPCPLLRQMVEAGLHGRKSGRGFYPYVVTD
jgi:3-hydroxybutyryl-CoA dehydrogenase